MLKSPTQKTEDGSTMAMTNRLLFVVAVLASRVDLYADTALSLSAPGRSCARRETIAPPVNDPAGNFEPMDEPPPDSGRPGGNTPFIQDQESLQNPMGVLVTLAMVIVAAVLCGVAIFLSL